jgi:hypothetical protein
MKQSHRWFLCDFETPTGPCEAETEPAITFDQAAVGAREAGWAINTTRRGKVVDLCPQHRGAATR